MPLLVTNNELSLIYFHTHMAIHHFGALRGILARTTLSSMPKGKQPTEWQEIACAIKHVWKISPFHGGELGQPARPRRYLQIAFRVPDDLQIIGCAMHAIREGLCLQFRLHVIMVCSCVQFVKSKNCFRRTVHDWHAFYFNSVWFGVLSLPQNILTYELRRRKTGAYSQAQMQAIVASAMSQVARASA